MNESERFALVPRQSTALKKSSAGHEHILLGMVGDTLALVRASKSDLQTRRFRVGDIDFCEPDYRQILSWAGQTHLSPEDVLRRLTLNLWSGCYWCAGETRIEDGKFKTMNWDPGLLPITDFRITQELEITELTFVRIEEWRNWSSYISTQKVFSGSGKDFEKTYFSENRIHSIYTVHMPKLKRLFCRQIDLNYLEIKSAPSLESLDCHNNLIGALDLRRFNKLKDLECSENKITELKVNSNLEILRCSDNAMKELELDNLPNLVELECNHYNSGFHRLGGLQSLDLHGVHNLKSLECAGNSLGTLDLSFVRELKTLDCEWNLLTKLDLSGTPLLESLKCVCPTKEDQEDPAEFNPPWIIELNIQDLYHLKEFELDKRTHLVQRPDQHFSPDLTRQ
jgi:hypothetical protein